MRIMCLEIDNMTQLSDPDSQGDMYTASFELFPFHEGASYSFFMGIMNGNGPLRGHFCVVRATTDKFAEAKDWTHVMRRAREAQRLANEFNKHLGYIALTVQIPILTQIETVSDFACLFRFLKPHDKCLKPDEFITLEPFLEGTFQKFDSHSGTLAAHKKSKKRDCLDDNDDDDDNSICGTDSVSGSHLVPILSTNIAQAFSHFCWHLTRKLVVCGLQGVSNGVMYTVTNPTIHSMDHQFGDSDGSILAITEFFSSHCCNNICCRWETCNVTGKSQHHVNIFQQPKHPSSLNKYKSTVHSAPFLFDNCLGTLL